MNIQETFKRQDLFLFFSIEFVFEFVHLFIGAFLFLLKWKFNKNNNL